MWDRIMNQPQMDRKLKSQGNLCQDRFAIESLKALNFKGVLGSVIYVQTESLDALRLKGACFVIDIRCESLEAKIRQRYNVFLIKPRQPLWASEGVL